MFIYKTTNLINNKIYIGKSTKTNRHYLGSGKIILRAIKKYGKENFKREVIEDNIENTNILNQREIYWIDFYDSRNPIVGYNITKGGSGTNLCGEKNGMFGKNHTEESKRLMSLHKTGVKMSDEFREMASIHSSGSRNPNYGVISTDEKKAKISSSEQGKKVKNKISQYVGVAKGYKGKWDAGITHQGVFYRLGSFKIEIEAALAYDKKALELYGENAKLNFPKLKDNWAYADDGNHVFVLEHE